MKRWPLIRHIRYLWLSWKLRRIAGRLPSQEELALLNDVWEGRA
jgi:hypothetical protein